MKQLWSHFSCGCKLLFARWIDQPRPETVLQMRTVEHEAVALNCESCSSVGGALRRREDRGIWIGVEVEGDGPRRVVDCCLPCELLPIQRDSNDSCAWDADDWHHKGHGVICEGGWLDLQVSKPDHSSTSC